jgi:hypothetical protein
LTESNPKNNGGEIGMFKKFTDKAKQFADKAELSSKLESAIGKTKQVTTEQLEALNPKAGNLLKGNWQKMEEAISKVWPTIESELVKRLIDLAEGKLSNVNSLESIFNDSYKLIPIPFRLVLPRKYFLDYCMSHREPLLEKVKIFKADKLIANARQEC